MVRFGTMFSGGEGVGVGLTAAGLHHVWGIEYDAGIAAVAQRNGFDVHVADVRQVDYASLPAVDWLHASPVCTRASVANSGAVESQEDIDTAAAVVRALKAQLQQAQDATSRLQDALGVAQEGFDVYYGMYKDLSAKEARR